MKRDSGSATAGVAPERDKLSISSDGANCKIARSGGAEAGQGVRTGVSNPLQYPLRHIPLWRRGIIRFASNGETPPEGVYHFDGSVTAN